MDVPSFLKKQNLKYLFQRIFKFPTFSTFGPDICPYLIALLSLSLYIMYHSTKLGVHEYMNRQLETLVLNTFDRLVTQILLLCKLQSGQKL